MSLVLKTSGRSIHTVLVLTLVPRRTVCILVEFCVLIWAAVYRADLGHVLGTSVSDNSAILRVLFGVFLIRLAAELLVSCFYQQVVKSAFTYISLFLSLCLSFAM